MIRNKILFWGEGQKTDSDLFIYFNNFLLVNIFNLEDKFPKRLFLNVLVPGCDDASPNSNMIQQILGSYITVNIFSHI